jgi:two-component sensor histidine kinase
VINALKNAFPDHASGTIKVGYHSDGPAWTLSVSDNGIGMPALSEAAHSGLGSSIVGALARKLNASVEIADGDPGTTVSISNALPAADSSGASRSPAGSRRRSDPRSSADRLLTNPVRLPAFL